MSSYYSADELDMLPFRKIGKNLQLSKKTSLYGIKNISIGDNCRIDDYCVISCGTDEGFHIGSYVHIGNSVSITGKGKITINDFAGLSGHVSVYSSTDDYSGEFMSNPCVGAYDSKLINVYSNDIYIGKHVLIGCNSVVLPNTHIADGISIGALSIVNSKLDKIGIYQGNPLKFIKDKSMNFLKLEQQITHIPLINTITPTNPMTLSTDIFKDFGINITEAHLNSTLSEIGLDSLSTVQFCENMFNVHNVRVTYDTTVSDILAKLGQSNKATNKATHKATHKATNKATNKPSDKPLPIVSILGVGSCLPSKKIDNSYYEQIMDTSDAWIKSRTGMETKYLLDADETLETLIKISCENAIRNANISVDKVDLLIVASSSQEDLFGDASKISHVIGATNAFAFDIKVACNGFTTAVITAEQYIKSGDYNFALVIGADCLSRWLDWSDKKTAILFGDGAGAVVLGKGDNGILGHLLKTDGSKNSILNIHVEQQITTINECDQINNQYSCITMDGLDVFKFVTHNLPIYITQLVNKLGLNLSDIDHFAFHQANQRILDELCAKLNVDPRKMLTNVSKVGNTSAASIPILLDEIHNTCHQIKKGDLVLIGGFGAGMSVGLFLIKWNIPRPITSNLISDVCKSYNKVALVTGGTKGIGLAIANKLCEDGYETIVISRTSNPLLSDKITFIKADICNVEDLTNVQQFIKRKYGKLDILINNAGWEGVNELFINTSLDNVHQIINTNLIGTLNVTNLMTDLLKDANGTIINMSSVSSFNNNANCYRKTLYSLSKSAISTFTRGLSGELKNTCKVYSINPTFVDTDIADRIATDFKINKHNLNNHGIIENDNQLIKPEEIAFFIHLLINGQTRYISGDEIVFFSKLRTTYAKYLYQQIDSRVQNLKIIITDIEAYAYNGNGINNVCIFQGQGIAFNKNLKNVAYQEILLEKEVNMLLRKWCKVSLDDLETTYMLDETNTHYQQLIIYIISICEFELSKQADPTFFNSIRQMAGYSIGEVSALVCAGFINFEDGLKIVELRGYEMNEINNQIRAKMVTVIGLSDTEINALLTSNIYITNDISHNIKVVGGLIEEVDDFLIKLKRCDNVRIKELNVSGAYHTTFYEEVGHQLKRLLMDITIRETNVKVYSNYTGEEYNKENLVTLLSSQVCNRVEWYKNVQSLKEMPIHEVREYGPSASYLKPYLLK
jgi:3-oxoacyl-[acyl-carrier-protein] synthase-3